MKNDSQMIVVKTKVLQQRLNGGNADKGLAGGSILR
jgi:hypothetical protein